MRACFRNRIVLAALSSALCLSTPAAWAGIKVFGGEEDDAATPPPETSTRPETEFDPGSSERLALVISTQDYDAAAYDVMETSIDDGNAVAAALRELGYRVMRVRDADRDGLVEDIETFAEAVEKGSTIVVYYSGLGSALPYERDNRLIPSDFPDEIPDTPSAAWQTVKKGTLALEVDVLQPIRFHGPKAMIVFYDACRVDAFADADVLQRNGATASCRPLSSNGAAILYGGGFGRALVAALAKNATQPIGAMMDSLAASNSDVQLLLSPDAEREGVCVAPVDGACDDPASSPPPDEIKIDTATYVPESGERTGNGVDVAAVLRVCDDLAAHPGNDENADGVEGVMYGAIDGPKALPACLKALELAPDSLRIRYQLARAKQSAGQEASALKDLEKLAEEDQYPPALSNLGATYQLGIGVPKNDSEAARWYEAAANKGFVPSMAVLGWMYQAGRGVPKNNSKAFKWYLAAAKGGAPSAMHNVGFMYQNGWGTDTDEAQAAKWFKAAADEDFPQALAMTGWLYQTGRGLPKDMVKAVDMYRRASAKDVASAMGALGGLYDTGEDGIAQSPSDAARWLMKAVRRGHDATRSRLIDHPKTLTLETRREVQKQLRDMGFDPGPTDGVFGKKTRDAIDEAFTAP